MNDDRFRALIEEADVKRRTPSATSLELAGRVRVLCCRRRRRQMALAVVAVLVLSGLLWHGRGGRQGGEPAESVPENTDVRSVEALQADDRWREATEQIEHEELVIERLLA